MGVSLITPESVWQLQQALHAKAKREPACRFHSLYDKVYRKDVLLHAWRCCRANGGAPGVDGVTFEQIEASGVGGWLEELVKELRGNTYRPEAVRRVWIPKPVPLHDNLGEDYRDNRGELEGGFRDNPGGS
jgi:retron-type reverse transcriptase